MYTGRFNLESIWLKSFGSIPVRSISGAATPSVWGKLTRCSIDPESSGSHVDEIVHVACKFLLHVRHRGVKAIVSFQ